MCCQWGVSMSVMCEQPLMKLQSKVCYYITTQTWNIALCKQDGIMDKQTNGRTDGQMIRLLDAPSMPFRPWAYKVTDIKQMFIMSNKFIFIRPSSDGTIMVWWCPSVRLSVRPSDSPSARFPHFSHTCFDILSWNFAHDFVLMYYRSSLSVFTLRQFWKELCLFVNLDYR